MGAIGAQRANCHIGHTNKQSDDRTYGQSYQLGLLLKNDTRPPKSNVFNYRVFI